MSKFQIQNLRNTNQTVRSGGTEESGRGLTSFCNELRLYVTGQLAACAVAVFPTPAFHEILGGRHSVSNTISGGKSFVPLPNVLICKSLYAYRSVLSPNNIRVIK